MTKGRLCEFSTVTIDDRSMTDWSLIFTVLNSLDVMKDQIFLAVELELELFTQRTLKIDNG